MCKGKIGVWIELLGVPPWLVTLPWAVSGLVITVADKILKAELKEQLTGGTWF